MPATRTPEQVRAAQLLERCRRDPVYFCEHVLGIHLWSRQRPVLEAVRDSRRTAVRAGHGVGKTYVAGAAVLWFLCCFPGARVITTATTEQQVRDLLWRAIRELHEGAVVPLGGELSSMRLELDDGRFAVGMTARPENAESFQGHHAEHLLVLVDEASGVDEAILGAAEGYMTTAGARMLLISNPTQRTGTFYEAFHSRRDRFTCVHISVLDAPAFTGEDVPAKVAAITSPEWVEEMRGDLGEDSPEWAIKVLGDFPKQATDAVVPLHVIEGAHDRDEPAPRVGQVADVVIGVDVARFGGDETVIALRVGRHVRIRHVVRQSDLMHVVGLVLELAREAGNFGDPLVVVDDTGVGGGVTDRLREHGVRVRAFNGAERARRPDKYPNRRSELWFTAAEVLAEVDLDGDARLAADLTAPRYRLDSHARRQVEPKADTRKRLGRSPDRADAVLLCLEGFAAAPSIGPPAHKLAPAVPAHELPYRRFLMVGETGGAGHALGGRW